MASNMLHATPSPIELPIANGSSAFQLALALVDVAAIFDLPLNFVTLPRR